MKRQMLLTVAAAAAVLTAGACGGDDGAETDAAGGDDPAPVDTSEDEPWEPEWVDGVLQPLPDGFPDRELTVVAAADAASPDAIFATHLQEAASDYSPVPIEINVTGDVTGFGSWEAIHQVNGEDGGDEGYHNVTFNSPGSVVDLLTTLITDDLGLELDSIKPVMSFENGPWLVVECSDEDAVPWEPTMEDMVQWTRDNPGDLRYMAGGAGSGLDLAFQWYMSQLDGDEVNYIPSGSAAERVTAVAACEGQVTTSPVDIALPHIQGGRLDIVMVSGDTPLEDYPDVPTSADLDMPDDPAGVTRQLVVPASVPDLHVQWLFELWRAVAEDPGFVENRRSSGPGTVVSVTDPEESTAFNQNALDRMDEVVRDLGIHVDQQ